MSVEAVKSWSSLEGAAVSFDHIATHPDRVVFTYTLRDSHHSVLETFHTELHAPLQDRPLTSAETAALLAFGVFHSTYVYLPFATEVKLLQVRAGQLSKEQLQFYQAALEGALAEYFYLADIDLKDAFRVQCCADIADKPQDVADKPQDVAEKSETIGAVDAGTRNSSSTQPLGSQPPRVLVPFGGGKDSTLLIQLLHDCGCDVQWAYYGEWLGSWGDYPKFTRLVEASPSKTVLVAEQHLPCIQRLQELNLRPDINFTDYVAYVSYYVFSSAFLALQRGFTAVCVGNEYSANAINLLHPRYGYEINHQYEKSFKAECAFSEYIRQYVSPSLLYFSGLQHMSELEIAKRFATHCTRYLPFIISCNWATDDDWCGGCEKCAFVYCIFCAYMPTQTVMDIFKRTGTAAAVQQPSTEANPNPIAADPDANTVLNLSVAASPSVGIGGSAACAAPAPAPAPPATLEPGLADMFDSPSHLPVFESLMGLSGHKPFECVGTSAEVLAALYLAAGRNYPSGKALPLLLQRHRALVMERGQQAWGQLNEEMTKAEAGELQVPTLYPAWYQWASPARPGAGNL